MRRLRARDAAVEVENATWRKAEVNAEALRRVARACAAGVSEGELEAAAKRYGDAMGGFAAFGETIDAITRLARHYKLIALSNVDRATFRRTCEGALRDCADAIIAAYIAEDIGSYKPARANFAYLLAHLESDFGIERQELCHVAQSLYHDHATTRVLGIRSVWVDRYGVLRGGARDEESLREEYGFVARVETLREVADAVDEAFAVEAA